MLKTASSFIAAAALALIVSQPVGATVISPTTSVGSAATGDGAGLSGSFYKINTTYLTSLDQGRKWTASLSPTATFAAVSTCFPSCGTNTPDSSGLVSFLGNAASGLSANVVDLSHSFLRLAGYVSIAAPGTYNFSVGADDGTSLSIGGSNIMLADGVYSYQVNAASATFSAAGLYPILLEHIENGGSSALSLTNNGVALSGMMLSSTFRSNASPTSVPEPASLALLGVAMLGLGLIRIRT